MARLGFVYLQLLSHTKGKSVANPTELLFFLSSFFKKLQHKIGMAKSSHREEEIQAKP